MKVLHISTFDNAGAGLCCSRIHQALLSSGIDSKMLVMHNTQHTKEEYECGFWRIKANAAISKILRRLGILLSDRNKVIALAEKYNTTYTLPTSIVDISKNELINWADIIHLHWVNGYIDYPSFFSRIKKPIVWTLHDENLFYGIAHHNKCILRDNPLEVKYRRIKSDAVKNAANLSIVFLSQMMKENFDDEDIIKGRYTTVINNSVNPELFKPSDKLEVRTKMGFDLQATYFVFIATDISDANKGLALLSDALNKIDSKIKIIAVGGNPHDFKRDNVLPVGFTKDQKELSEFISCADYMAMPSYQEAFSQSPLEALACGLPIIVFPVSGTKELVIDDNGVVCDDFTVESLENGIRKLLLKKFDRDYIRRDVINRFSSASIIKKYIDLYNRVLE